jgi:hypothetical protein
MSLQASAAQGLSMIVSASSAASKEDPTVIPVDTKPAVFCDDVDPGIPDWIAKTFNCAAHFFIWP